MLQVGGYKLRDLPDDEYGEAEEIAFRIKGSKGLDYCPTCKMRYPADPEDEKPRVYYYRHFVKPCDCAVQVALFARYLLAGIPEQYMRLNWEDYSGSEDARIMVGDYLERWVAYRDNGVGVEFGGPKLGIGKTFAATHLGKEMVKRRQKVFFVPFVEMVAAFEKENAEALEEKIRWTPYVILDDIMPPKSERQENFYHTRFEAMIRHRTNYNLPTFITTNLTTDELDKYYPRTYSLLGAKQVRINMTGKDFRQQMGEENMSLIAEGETRPIT